MYTPEESTILNQVHRMLAGTNVEYVFMTRDRSEEPKSYYTLYSPCTDEDAAYFMRFLLEVMWESASDFGGEDQSRNIDKEVWKKEICKAALKRSKENKDRMVIKKRK